MQEPTHLLVQPGPLPELLQLVVGHGRDVPLDPLLDEVRTTGGARVSELVERLGVSDMTVRRDVAEVLHDSGRDDLTVVLTGGQRTPSDALVGPVAVAALRGLHVDWLLLGVHGMDAEAGFTTPNLEEAETNRALVASARRVAWWPTTRNGEWWG